MKLRILAVTSPERLIAAPELPTVAEGSFPGLTNQSTIGPVAPAETPKPEVDRFRLRSQSRHDARKIPASPRSRCCFCPPVVEALGLKID
jgi:hypothetical protein